MELVYAWCKKYRKIENVHRVGALAVETDGGNDGGLLWRVAWDVIYDARLIICRIWKDSGKREFYENKLYERRSGLCRKFPLFCRFITANDI